MFFIFFLIFLLLMVIELFFSNIPKTVFNLNFLLITLLLSIRYGFGIDYFNYNYLFNAIPNVTSELFWTNQVYGEFGFKLIIGVLKEFGFRFSGYIFIMTFIVMGLIYRFIIKYSDLKFTSLFIFYCMYLFTYVNSAIRQGLTLALFLGILYPLLERKKYFSYVLLTILFSSFHVSILVVLVLPLIKFKFNKNSLLLSLLASFLLLISFRLFNISKILGLIPFLSTKLVYLEVESINIFPIFTRCVTFFLILYLLSLAKDKDLYNSRMVQYYMLGFLLFICLSQYPTIASRFNVYFKAFEIIIIPALLYKFSKERRANIITFILIVFFSFMWGKEVQSQISRSNYNENINIFNYPFTTIFDKEKIFEYKNVQFLDNFDDY
ncbi:EpsG family protein [Carnobacterium maltaromaticum]|uniref:EpsG family protein n=1 Tax=Carnobacterium maltaromaticum TaxID=2751 RepID=UPI00295E8BBE|nr:EpsG family protein [Carnobacterium maltaromaticum]